MLKFYDDIVTVIIITYSVAMNSVGHCSAEYIRIDLSVHWSCDY